MTGITRTLISLSSAALVAMSLSVTASAQTPAASNDKPSYATRSAGETIKGTVRSIDGKYAISIRDDRGFVDNVTLHEGTIINPRGLTLAPGQSVSIAGTNAGRTFIANEIDTPYVSYGDAWDPYAYPYVAYPYPIYGAGFGFGGPHFGVGFRGRW